MAISARPIGVYPITTRELVVLRAADVTPGMRRITPSGEQLRDFRADSGFDVPAFRSDGFDDDFKIILCHPDLDEAIVPTQADGTLVWPRDPRVVMRTYTVRRWDPVLGELDVDFVKHGSGPATSWAYRVRPGDRVQIAGPKLAAGQPADVDWILIAGDETTLPAIGRWLEEFPSGVRGQVFIEVADAAHRQDLAEPDGVSVTWLYRDGAPAGTTTQLFDAVRAAPWWDGRVFAWAAGEAGSLAPLRSWLRRDKELPKEYVDVTGYWRRRGEPADAVTEAAPEAGTVEENDEVPVLNRLELAPAFAVRTAVTIGLFEALGGGDLTLTDLAKATNTTELGLTKLVTYLRAVGLVEVADHGHYRLSETGSELDDEHARHELSLDGPHAARDLGILALLAAVRTGRGDYERWFGTSYRELSYADADALAHGEDDPDLIVETIAKSPLLAEPSTLVIQGRGAGAYAVALADTRSDLSITVVRHPSELNAIRSVHGEHERITLDAFSFLKARTDSPDGVLLINLLESLPDDDAVHILGSAAQSVGPGGAVFLLGSPIDHTGADEYDYEDDLIEFAVKGGGGRTRTEYEGLFHDAGLSVDTRATVGWGEFLFRLVPAIPTR